MRNLSKVVFINSANIPYAEVRLDGNVHFIGTQGVGKSTILRAILFFYNADKTHLGIPKEKKNFDSFYLPFTNSYIVYEVFRETGSYCVCVSRNMGRAAFRFIDAPYDRRWFMAEDNSVLEDWPRIRERISSLGKCSPTKIISSYEWFRDIIYGNNRRPEMVEFRKYAVLESSKYQNIPRTVQNVFLNAKLDAEFIKDTIIKSMTDNDISIDLEYFRTQIHEFENEYNDISLWVKKEKNGMNLKTEQANDVLNKYRGILYSQKRIADLREEMNYALRLCNESLAPVRDKIAAASDDLGRIRRLISEETGKYNREMSFLVREIAILENKIKDSRSKRKYYEKMDISGIIARVGKEDELKVEKAGKESVLNKLMAGSLKVSEKYKLLESALRQNSAEKKNLLQTQINALREDRNKANEGIISWASEEEKRIRMMCEASIRMAQEAVDTKKNELTERKIEKEHILVARFFENDISEKNCVKKQFEDSIARLESEKYVIQHDKEALTWEEDSSQKEIDAAFSVKIEAINKESGQISEEIARLRHLQDNYNGSFYEWLEKNVPGWEGTIGRIADESSVLYSRSLNPEKVQDCSGSLYGVRVDLSSVERRALSPVELKEKISDLEKQLEERKLDIEKALNSREIEKTAVRSKFQRKVKDLTDRSKYCDVQIIDAKENIKKLKVEIDSLNDRAANERKGTLQMVEDCINKLSYELEMTVARLNSEKESLSKKLTAVQRQKAERQSKVLNEYSQKESVIVGNISDVERELQEELRRNAENRDRELSGAGADVATLRRYEDEISRLDAELKYISENKVICIEYNKDKRELFDSEDSFCGEKAAAESRRTGLDEKFRQRNERRKREEEVASQSLDGYRKQLEEIESNINEANDFLKDAQLNPAAESTDRERPSMGKSCKEIKRELTERLLSRDREMKNFRMSVTRFRDGFSPRNLFNFKSGIESDSEFIEFAENLDTFMTNNMLGEYQRRISERYTDIIRRVSKETSDMTENKSEICKIINEINSDFSRDNFVGAIKDISLRQQPSEDKTMQLLLSIKEFNEENQYNMGEVDLFSDDGRADVNSKAVDYLIRFMKALQSEPDKKELTLSDSFKLEFRIVENDNDTGWIEKISNVGSDGTDILVKAMLNIMLISVFKSRVSRKFDDFRIHCMMDEIGKLHPSNIRGILQFANNRNILLINSSPTTFNADDYKYTYLLQKDLKNRTGIIPLVKHLEN